MYEMTEALDRQILDKAIELTKKYGWVKEAMALDAKGKEVDPLSSSACSFCTIGFLSRASYEVAKVPYVRPGVSQKVYTVLNKMNMPPFMSIYNDDYARSLNDITKLFEAARDQ